MKIAVKSWGADGTGQTEGAKTVIGPWKLAHIEAEPMVKAE